jgi:hypothetical protein
MQQNNLKKLAATTSKLALTFLAVNMIGLLGARAEDPKAMFKEMSNYLTSQNAIAFDYDANLDVVTTEGERLGLASSGKMTLNRPNKLHATRTGGFADVEVGFDGTNLTLLGKNAKVYAQVPVPGNIDHLVDELRNTYGRPVPAADLLLSNPYEQLIPLVKEAKDLGSGVIGGVECDHLAFRTDEVDWQIWIAQGTRRYPCRYVITSSHTPGLPAYTIDVRSWKTGAEVADNFSVSIPAGATQLKPVELTDFDDVGGIFKLKQEK